MPVRSERPWPDFNHVGRAGSRTHYHGEHAGTCPRCGIRLAWRVGEKVQSHGGFRAYKVNESDRQYHNASCVRRHAEPIQTIGTVQETLGSTIHPEDQEPAETLPRQDGLAAMLAAAVAPLIPTPKATIDEETVRRIVAAELAADGSRAIEVRVHDSGKAPVNVGRQHMAFDDLLAFVAAGENVYLVGPAGTGKSSAAWYVSQALDRQFGAISVFKQMPASQIFGHRIGGEYFDTSFRRCYEFGGVFLFDEIDHGDSNTMGSINQATENGHCAFPDRMVTRHPDFVCIAAANTYGRGADREYVGALQMDGATRDRFAFLPWDIDENLEWDIASATYHAHGGTDSQVFAAWLGKVRAVREKVAAHKMRHVVSPRASIKGAKMLARGMALSKVETAYLWKGLDTDARRRVEA